MKECKEDKCFSPSRKRGWCESHYNLIWRRNRYEKKFERYPFGFPVEKKLSLKSKLNEENGCVEWLKPHSSGYGYTTAFGEKKGAHIISWELANGRNANGYLIMHKCDNRKCINPDHLMIGDDALNQKDKVLKGRQAKGNDFKSTKLNENIIKEIFCLFRNGYRQRQIAEKFNVDPSNISNILNRKRWRHVEISL